MAEQLLHGADVGAILEQVGGKGVAEGVAGGALGQAGLPDGQLDCALKDGLVLVVAAPLAGLTVDVVAALPSPLGGEGWG